MTFTIDTDKLATIRSALQKGIQAQKKYCIQTFGCQMNHADSEKIHMLLAQAGLSKVDTWKEADIVIFNTCSVRQKGEDKVFGFVEEIDRLRHKIGKDIKVGLTGCMTRKTGLNKKYYNYQGRANTTKISLTQEGDKIDTPTLFNSDDELFIRSDNIDFVVRIEEIGSLTALLSIMYGEDVGQDDTFQSYLRIRQERDDSGSANIIIQTGCDNYCTFCIVPYTRGHEISRPMSEIVSEVSEAASYGAKEVTLLGQNVNSYGKETRKNLWNPEELKWATSFTKEVSEQSEDGGFSSVTPLPGQLLYKGASQKTPFRELLEKINAIPGLDRIRFTSSNPHDMTRDILDAHFDLDKCCHYLHFALQSGDNDLLKKMNRKHTYDDFKFQVDYLRSRDPLFGISTDVIVGFPGETEEQFENTVKAFQECQFDYAYIARYSPRKLTYASKMSNQIPADIKAKRWDKLNMLMYEIIQKRHEMMIGREEVIMVSKIDKEDGTISGRTRNFKEVYLPKNEKIQLGDIIPVKILELDRWVLRGEVR